MSLEQLNRQSMILRDITSELRRAGSFVAVTNNQIGKRATRGVGKPSSFSNVRKAMSAVAKRLVAQPAKQLQKGMTARARLASPLSPEYQMGGTEQPASQQQQQPSPQDILKSASLLAGAVALSKTDFSSLVSGMLSRIITKDIADKIEERAESISNDLDGAKEDVGILEKILGIAKPKETEPPKEPPTPTPKEQPPTPTPKEQPPTPTPKEPLKEPPEPPKEPLPKEPPTKPPKEQPSKKPAKPVTEVAPPTIEPPPKTQEPPKLEEPPKIEPIPSKPITQVAPPTIEPPPKTQEPPKLEEPPKIELPPPKPITQVNPPTIEPPPKTQEPPKLEEPPKIEPVPPKKPAEQAKPVGKPPFVQKPSSAAVPEASVAVNFIKAKERFSGKAYWDVKGYSVGYGHFIQPKEAEQKFIDLGGGEKVVVVGDKGKDTTITREQADKLFAKDLKYFEKGVASSLGESWDKLNENQKAALVSYAYNTGMGGFRDSLIKKGLKDAINAGDTEKAAKLIETGIATTQRGYSQGLAARRKEEADLFRKKTVVSSLDQDKAPQTPDGERQEPPQVADTSPSATRQAALEPPAEQGRSLDSRSALVAYEQQKQSEEAPPVINVVDNSTIVNQRRQAPPQTSSPSTIYSSLT